jgi:hypothetical protein
VVQLHVHLVERLLHAQQVFATRAHQALAMSHQRTHGTHRRRRPERGVEQTDRVQVLQPLAVLHVGLAAWHIFDVASVDQADLQPPRLQHLEQRHPIHAGCLHRHRAHATLDQPVGEGL